MSFDVLCCMCGEYLGEPGALVFSPPNPADLTVKRHVCMYCWEDVKAFLEGPNTEKFLLERQKELFDPTELGKRFGSALPNEPIYNSPTKILGCGACPPPPIPPESYLIKEGQSEPRCIKCCKLLHARFFKSFRQCKCKE